MSYFSLRIVSIIIRLAAIATAFFVVLLFFVNIDRQYQARVNVRSFSQEFSQQMEASSAQLQAYNAQMESLLRQLGIDMDLDAYAPTNTSIADPTRPASEELLRSITLRNFEELFVGLVASLLIFGFGGIIKLLIDIAGRETVVDYASYSKPDSNLAPTAPKPLASFPPPPDHLRKKNIPAPPGTYDERLRDKRR